MSMLTKELVTAMLSGLPQTAAEWDALQRAYLGAVLAIERGDHTVIETEALRLDRETMRIQSDRIRCLEDELKEARAELKRLSGAGCGH